MKKPLLRRALLLLVAVAGSALVPMQRAHASLVTFAIDGQFGQGDSCICSGFEPETGLTLPGPYDLTALFTVDPTAYTGTSFAGLVDAPGTGLSVTVGKLTLIYSPYELSFSELPLEAGVFCDEISVTAGGFPGVVFGASNCAPGGPTVPGFSGGGLEDFVTHSLSGFVQPDGGPVEDVITSPEGTSDWWLEGGTIDIHVVPEPPELASLALALVGLGFIRRPKAH